MVDVAFQKNTLNESRIGEVKIGRVGPHGI